MSPINPAKLQKQLEQKALEEKKNREKAISNIQKIHQLLAESEKSGLDVSEFQKGLKEVQTHMREREFSEAAERSEKVIEEMESSLEKLVKDRIGRAEDIIVKAKNLGIDVSSQEESLKNAGAMLGKKDYFAALGEANSCIDSLSSRMGDAVGSVIEETEGLVNALSSTVDVSESLSLLKEARKKLEEGETDAVLELCEKAKELVKDAADSAAESLISDAEINITILERMGADADDLKSKLNKVKGEEGPDRIKDIMEVGRLARGRVKDSLRSLIEKLSPDIETIKDLGGNPSEVESLIKKASDNIENNNLALSAETLERAKKKAEEEKFNAVVKAMNPAFTKMKAASKIGANISVPEKLLLDARNALKMGEYRKAMDLSKECESHLDEMLEAYQKTSELLPKLDKLFKEAEKINADTGEAKRLLLSVKQALGERDFVRAYSLALKTQEALEQGKTAGVKQAISSGMSLIKLGEDMGLDMVEEEVSFQEAEKAMNSGDYVKASKFADSGLKDAREKIKKHISERFNSMESDLESIKDSIDVKEKLKLIAKGKKYLEFGDLVSAAQSLKGLESSMEDIQKDMASAAVERVKSLAEELLAEEGVQDQALEDALAEMLALYKEGKYSAALKASEEVEKSANRVAKGASQKAYNDAKAMLSKTKNIQGNVDLKRFHDALLDARAEFKRGEYVKSMHISINMMNELDKLLSLYQNALSSFTMAQNSVKKARKKGMDVTKEAKQIFKGRKLMEEGKYEEVIKLSEEINRSLSDTSAKQDIDSRMKMVEAKLFSARTMGIDMADITERLKKAKSLLADGKADKASGMMDEIEKDVELSLREAIEKKISVADSLISDARDIGINVKKAEESITVARDALSKGDYLEAYRYAEEAQKIIDDIKSVSKKVAEKIKEAHSKISEAESIRADVRNAKIVLDRAIEALKDNRTRESMELAEECIQMVEKAEKEKVERVIGDFVKIIERSKKTGMDASLAENLIHQARNAMEEGRYKKALSLAMQSEVEMEKAELQKDIAEKAIKTLNEKIEEVRKKGISVEDVLAMLNRAEGAYDAGAYIKSFEYTMKAGEKLQDLTEAYEEIDSDLNELEIRLNEARENHIDVVKPSEMYVSAKSALEQGRVEDARKIIKAALKAMDKLFLEHVDEIIDYADAKIKYAKKVGANVSEAETAIKEAKKIKEKSPSKALRLANGARAMVESSSTDTSFVDRAYSINFEISRAKRFGVDVKSAEKLLKEAIDSVERDQEKADETLSKADEEVKRALGRLTPDIDVSIDADELEKDVWKPAIVRVSNKGSAPAKEIRMNVSGDVEIEGLNALEDLDKGSTAEVSVKIMAQKEGDIPVNMHISAKRIFDDKEFEFSQEKTLKTREKPKEAAPPKEVTAEKMEKCKFCNGSIKPGMQMVVCGSCGATYHVPCSKRAGNCKVCGAPLETKSKSKVARKKLAIKLG